MRFDALLTVSTLAELRDDVLAAASFLTRLPVARFASPDTGLLARSMRAFPIVGIAVGLIGWAVFALAGALALPAAIAALLALVATVLTTGALHEDGLADTFDGFGGSTPERKLEIMRDSRIGTYGASALAMSLMLRIAALASLAGPAQVALALVAAHAGARAMLPLFLYWVPPARPDGLSAEAGRPSGSSVAAAGLLGLMVLAGSFGAARSVAALVLLLVVLAIMRRLCLAQIGGQTGDTAGALEQVSEIAILLTAAAT